MPEHEFDSSMTCSYCGVSEFGTKRGEQCPSRTPAAISAERERKIRERLQEDAEAEIARGQGAMAFLLGFPDKPSTIGAGERYGVYWASGYQGARLRLHDELKSAANH